jgi:predicted  nucleic acid-binding Zn-ribbon protein
MSNDEDDRGLYDDMEDAKLAANTTAPTQNNSNYQQQHQRFAHNNNDRPKSLTDQVVDLQSTVQRLEQENETLKRNMGTLFRTATAELARKDRQLHDLRRELEAAQQQQP